MALIVVGSIGGCFGPATDRPVDMGGEAGTKIATLIEDMNDAKGAAAKMAPLMAAAPAAAEAKKFEAFEFYIVGQPTVTGTTGTAKVQVMKSESGEKVGEVEWTFEEAGGAWKVKTAPLP